MIRLATQRPLTMDAEENYLYYSNEKLLRLIALSKDRDEAIREYLRTVKYAPITDFKAGKSKVRNLPEFGPYRNGNAQAWNGSTWRSPCPLPAT